jgi:hypothetical protein
MSEWTVEQIERARARLLYDVSDEALERCRRAQQHDAALGYPMRCKTNIVAANGDCRYCGAINGEACRAQ